MKKGIFCILFTVLALFALAGCAGGRKFGFRKHENSGGRAEQEICISRGHSFGRRGAKLFHIHRQ